MCNISLPIVNFCKKQVLTSRGREPQSIEKQIYFLLSIDLPSTPILPIFNKINPNYAVKPITQIKQQIETNPVPEANTGGRQYYSHL